MTNRELVKIDPMACFWTDAEEVFDPIRTLSSELHGIMPPRLPGGVEFKVSETKKEFQVSVKTPGYEKKHLKVSVKKGALAISGERSEESEEKTACGCVRHSSFGSFSRTLPLPKNVGAGKSKVDFNRGELKVTLPKK